MKTCQQNAARHDRLTALGGVKILLPLLTRLADGLEKEFLYDGKRDFFADSPHKWFPRFSYSVGEFSVTSSRPMSLGTQDRRTVL